MTWGTGIGTSLATYALRRAAYLSEVDGNEAGDVPAADAAPAAGINAVDDAGDDAAPAVGINAGDAAVDAAPAAGVNAVEDAGDDAGVNVM